MSDLPQKYRDMFKNTKPIVSGSSQNRYWYNKYYKEYLAELADYTENYDKKTPFKELYSFPTLSDPSKVTKADLIRAQEAIFDIQKKKTERSFLDEWRRNERERKKQEYLDAKAQAQKEKEVSDTISKSRINPDYPEPSEYIPDEWDDDSVFDITEMVANLREVLSSGVNTNVCNLLNAILDTTLHNDFDGLVQRLYGMEDYVLDLAATVAFESDPRKVYDAAVKLAELITGDSLYNQALAEAVEAGAREEREAYRKARTPKFHSSSSKRARDDVD